MPIKFYRQACIIVLLNLSVADGFPHAEKLLERAYPNVTIIWVKHPSSSLVVEFAGVHFRTSGFRAIERMLAEILRDEP